MRNEQRGQILASANRAQRAPRRDTAVSAVAHAGPGDAQEPGQLVRDTRGEIHGFLTGIFGDQENLEVPEPRDESLDTLMELGALLSGMQSLLEEPEKPASDPDLKALKVRLAKLTKIVEQEIHAVVMGARVLREQEGAMEEKAELTEH